MRDVARVADARNSVHHVARVFLQRVVHRRREVRAAAVVVDAEAAAHVDVLQARAHAHQLRIHVGELVDRILHAPDVLELAAGMAMHQLQAVEHVALFQDPEELHDLGDEQAELRLVARRARPAARAFTEELHAHAHPRAHAVGLGVLEDEIELFEVLDDRNDRATEFGRERHRFDVAVVLEAVADDQAFRLVLGHRHHGEQLGLGADFEAETELLAVAVDLLHDQALLVHLDGEHGGVAILVVVLVDGLLEGGMQVLQPMRQDVGETHHHRSGEVAGPQPLDDFEQIDVAPGLRVGPHDEVAVLVDREVALAPRVHVIQIEGVGNAPTAAWGCTSASRSRRISDRRPRMSAPKANGRNLSEVPATSGECKLRGRYQKSVAG